MSDIHEGEGEAGFVSIGEQLRRAREARGMSLDDVAGQTRIPIRHLQHIEREDWDALPAPTYAIGFARNYATAVGLDGPALANELRDRIGGPRRRAAPAPEYYEPADPARVPPRSLAIIALLLIVLLGGAYLLWRATLGADEGIAPLNVAEAAPDNGAPPAANDRASAPEGLTGQAVTLTAEGDAWLRISDGPDGRRLYEGILRRGESYAVPPDVQRPVIRTRRPQVLRATAAGRDLGLLGADERLIANLSLLPQDLAARGSGAAAAPAPAAPLSTPLPE